MASKAVPYSLKEKGISTLLIMTLLWLTVSLPYISDAQQYSTRIALESGKSSLPLDDSSNPVSGNPEEKAASGGINTLSEEYLHHPEEILAMETSRVSHSTFHLICFYETFHGELLCPPPNCLIVLSFFFSVNA